MDIPHEKSTRLIAACARSFKVEVQRQDIHKWSAGLTIAKALDTLVDEDHEYDSGTYAEKLLIGETIPYFSAEEATFVRNTYHELRPASQEQWRHSAKQLGVFALKRLDAESVDEYIDIALAESYLMSGVLKAENTKSHIDHLQRRRFNSWMTQMGRTAYLCDTLSDFIKDYNEGNVEIKPTPRAATTIARRAVTEIIAFTRITPAPIYAALAHRSATKTLEKVQRPNFWSKQFIVSKPSSISSVERSSQDL